MNIYEATTLWIVVTWVDWASLMRWSEAFELKNKINATYELEINSVMILQSKYTFVVLFHTLCTKHQEYKLKKSLSRKTNLKTFIWRWELPLVNVPFLLKRWWLSWRVLMTSSNGVPLIVSEFCATLVTLDRYTD